MRVGGKWRFVNRHPKGDAEFYGVYREINPPGRIVFTEIYAPFPDAESVVTATLTDENGKTRLNATSRYPSKEVRDMVLSTGMEKGAGISYDRLDEVAMELHAVARSRPGRGRLGTIGPARETRLSPVSRVLRRTPRCDPAQSEVRRRSRRASCAPARCRSAAPSRS